MPLKSTLPAFITKANILKCTNPSFDHKVYGNLSELVGVESEFISKTHQKPILRAVKDIKTLLRSNPSEADISGLNQQLCKCVLQICVNGVQDEEVEGKTSSSSAAPSALHNESVLFESMLSEEEKASHVLQSGPTEYSSTEFMRELLNRGVSSSSIQYSLAMTRFHSRAASSGTYTTLGQTEVHILLDEAEKSGREQLYDLDTEVEVEQDIAQFLASIPCTSLDSESGGSADVFESQDNNKSNLATKKDLHQALSSYPSSDLLLPNKDKLVDLIVFNTVIGVFTHDPSTRARFAMEFSFRSGGVFNRLSVEDVVTLVGAVGDNILRESEPVSDAVSFHGDYGSDNNNSDEELDEIHDLAPYTFNEHKIDESGEEAENCSVVIAGAVDGQHVENHSSTFGHVSSDIAVDVRAGCDLSISGHVCLDRAVSGQTESEPEVVATVEQQSGKRKTRSSTAASSSFAKKANTKQNRTTEKSSYNTRRGGTLVLAEHEVNYFVEVTLAEQFQQYGQQIRKLNEQALKATNDAYEWSDSTTKSKSKWVVGSKVASPTGMWYHILNEESTSSLVNTTSKPRCWIDMVTLSIILNKYLNASGRIRPYALVEVSANGTCLCNSILTALYLMPWFRQQCARKSVKKAGPPITALHLKRWVMFHIALHSHAPMGKNLDQNFLSMFRDHHPDKSYRKIHPHSVFSLQQECDNVMTLAGGGKCSKQVTRVARALHTVANGAHVSGDELVQACSIVDKHVQSFKQHRRMVYNDFMQECKQGMSSSKAADEMQLLAVWDILGLRGEVYDNTINSWLEFDGGHNSSQKPVSVILMKTKDHWFATVDLEHVRDDCEVTHEEKAMCSVVDKVWNPPEFNSMRLWSKDVGDVVSEIAVRKWALSDKQADIYKYGALPMPAELQEIEETADIEKMDFDDNDVRSVEGEREEFRIDMDWTETHYKR
eukprot:gene22857-29032_t